MKDKRAAFIILLILIISFIALVLSWMAYNKGGGTTATNSADSQKTAQLEKQVQDLTTSNDQMNTTIKNLQQNIQTMQTAQTTVTATQTMNPATPTTATQPDTQEAATPPSATNNTMTTKGVNVVLRSDSSRTSKPLRTLKKGETLTYLGQTKVSGGYTWYMVKDSANRLGWVASDYLK